MSHRSDDAWLRPLGMIAAFGDALAGVLLDSSIIFAVGMASLVVLGCRDVIERWL